MNSPQTVHTASGASDELLQLVSFVIGQEEFGIDILKVREINRMVEITQVPNCPAFVSGVINLRGRVIPIVDLRKRFGVAAEANDKHTRIIVVEMVGMVIGFIVDAVREVLRISKSIIEPPPALVGGIDKELITAIGKLQDRLLILLDLEKVLSQFEKETLASAA